MRRVTDGPVLVLTPDEHDAAAIEAILREMTLPACRCRDLNDMMQALAKGASAAVIADEALLEGGSRGLAGWGMGQPSWSDFPFILLTSPAAGDPSRQAALLDALGNVTVVARPLHSVLLRAALRSAQRVRRNEQRLRRLTETLEQRVEERTRELAAANRQLAAQIEERKRAEAALRRAQRLEAVGQLTSGVAHDFNNLLAAVLGNLELIERRTGDRTSLKLLRTALRAVERGAKLTDQLLAFSRKQGLAPEAMDINPVLEGMLALLQSTIGSMVRLDMVLQPGLWPALADPTQIELTVLNLAINARDAMSVGGRIAIETANVTLGPPERAEDPPAGDYIMLAVADSGAGMSEDVLARAFEPFFTTKERGKGSGLGLPTIYGMVRQSGGGVRIESRLGEGTTVRVYLPRAAVQPEYVPSREPAESPAAGNEVILLVDDDGDVREVTANVLRSLGYRVVEAGSGGAALDLLHREGKVDLLLLDFAMPGMNGVEVARFARERRPDLPILFTTGYAEKMRLAEPEGKEPVLHKPYRTAELAAALRRILEQARSTAPVRSPSPSLT